MLLSSIRNNVRYSEKSFSQDCMQTNQMELGLNHFASLAAVHCILPYNNV